MKLALALTASLVASGAILGAQQVVTFSTGLEMKTMKGAPYSADTATDSTQVLADGNRIERHSSGRVYRDSEGRTRREEDHAPEGAVGPDRPVVVRGPSVTINDPVANVSYTLDTTNHIAYKTSGTVSVEIVTNANRRLEELKTSVMEARAGGGAGGYVIADGRGGSEKGASRETLAPKTIEGVPAEGSRTTITIAAGAIGNDQPIVIVSEEWKSPDLGILLLTDYKDPRTGETTYKLTNIVRGDPDPSLFQVPADYTIKESGVRRFEPPQQ